MIIKEDLKCEATFLNMRNLGQFRCKYFFMFWVVIEKQ